jgi:hypothetical protein
MNLTQDLDDYISDLEGTVPPGCVPLETAIKSNVTRVRRKRHLAGGFVLVGIVALGSPLLIQSLDAKHEVTIGSGQRKADNALMSICEDKTLPPSNSVPNLQLDIDESFGPLGSGSTIAISGRLTNVGDKALMVFTDKFLSPFIVSDGVVVADPGLRRGTAIRITLDPGESHEYQLTVATRACRRGIPESPVPGEPLPIGQYALYAQLSVQFRGHSTMSTIQSDPVKFTVAK